MTMCIFTYKDLCTCHTCHVIIDLMQYGGYCGAVHAVTQHRRTEHNRVSCRCEVSWILCVHVVDFDDVMSYAQ